MKTEKKYEMSYEFAEKLIEMGFPAKVRQHTICEKCKHAVPPIVNSGYPTLEEIVRSCSHLIFKIHCDFSWYTIEMSDGELMKRCSTIDEALINLWIADKTGIVWQK